MILEARFASYNPTYFV